MAADNRASFSAGASAKTQTAHSSPAGTTELGWLDKPLVMAPGVAWAIRTIVLTVGIVSALFVGMHLNARVTQFEKTKADAQLWRLIDQAGTPVFIVQNGQLVATNETAQKRFPEACDPRSGETWYTTLPDAPEIKRELDESLTASADTNAARTTIVHLRQPKEMSAVIRTFVTDDESLTVLLLNTPDRVVDLRRDK